MTSKDTCTDCLVVENTVVILEQENFIATDLQVLYFFLTQSSPLQEISKYSIRFGPCPHPKQKLKIVLMCVS